MQEIIDILKELPKTTFFWMAVTLIAATPIVAIIGTLHKKLLIYLIKKKERQWDNNIIRNPTNYDDI